jgi:hypothetical protein
VEVWVGECCCFIALGVTEGKCVVASALLVGLLTCLLAEKGRGGKVGGKGRTSFQDLLRNRGHMQLHSSRHGLRESS